MLFKGLQINTSGSIFSLISYIRFDKLENFIDNLLHKFDKEICVQIKKRLKIRAKVKKELLVVDSGLVLRILL